MKKISIIGLGWFGEPLAKSLIKEGFDILGTTRTEEKKSELEKEKIKVELLNYPKYPSRELLESDIIVLNIPPFSEELEWFESWGWNDKSWVIFISSTSVYSKTTPSASMLKQQESWLQDHFKHWTILRFGGLIGPDRHPGKHLSGKKNLSGRLSPVNLIHLDDCIGVTKTIIEKNTQNEIFNVVSSEHPSREKYYTEYCSKHGLPAPEFDQKDYTVSEIVSNEKLLSIYPSFKPL